MWLEPDRQFEIWQQEVNETRALLAQSEEIERDTEQIIAETREKVGENNDR
jgi:hypothetical protein